MYPSSRVYSTEANIGARKQIWYETDFEFQQMGDSPQAVNMILRINHPPCKAIVRDRKNAGVLLTLSERSYPSNKR